MDIGGIRHAATALTDAALSLRRGMQAVRAGDSATATSTFTHAAGVFRESSELLGARAPASLSIAADELARVGRPGVAWGLLDTRDVVDMAVRSGAEGVDLLTRQALGLV